MHELEKTLSRVAFVLHSLRAGGCERQATLLLKELRKLGHETTVFVCHTGGIFQPELEEAGVNVKYLQRRFKGDVLGMVSSLNRELLDFQPDAVYSFLQVPNVFTALLGRRIKSMARLAWGLRSSNQDLRPYGRIYQIISWIERKLARVPDIIIANSTAGREFAISRGFPASQIIVIPNGIDTEHFQPRPKDRARLRSDWGIYDGDLVIGMVARLDPVKDHVSFLRAAAIVSQTHPHLKFVLAGGGSNEYSTKLRSMADDLGLEHRIIWLGNVIDPTEVYAVSDIATLTSSTGEGFPNTVGEAMASGVPCVVTDVGDCRHIVGETGIVTPPVDPVRLASAWIGMLTNDPKSKGIEARKRVLDEFSVQLSVERTATALQLHKS